MYDTEDKPWEPFVGGASAIIGSLTAITLGLLGAPRTVAYRLSTGRHSSDDREGLAEYPESGGKTRQKFLSKRTKSLYGRRSKDLSCACTSLTTKDPRIRNPSPSNLVSSHPQSASNSVDVLLSPVATEEPVEALRGLAASLSSSERTNSEGSENRDELMPTCQFQEMTPKHVHHAHTGLSKAVHSALKFPMDFAMSVARGFHNLPRAFGYAHAMQAKAAFNFEDGVTVSGKVRRLRTRYNVS
jgi:hypothetical protein